MTSIADKALLLRIQDKNNNLIGLVDAVTRASQVSGQVLDALDQRIANEYIAWSDLLTYFQKHSRPALFKSLYERNKPGEFDAAELFKIGYSDHDLEVWLCKKLYDTFNGKGLGVYCHIFEALSEHGGSASLEMMEVIKHELDPVIKTNRIVADSIRKGFSEEKGLGSGEAEQLIQNKFLNDFSENLDSAIELLRLRGVRLPDESTEPEESVNQPLIGRRHRVDRYMNKANTFLPDHPPEALNNMRKAAEAICKDILDSTFNASANSKSKPAKAFRSLEDMLSAIRRVDDVPDSIQTCLESLQSFGNFASHDQEEDPDNISADMAQSTLSHLKTVVDWYKTLNLKLECKDD